MREIITQIGKYVEVFEIPNPSKKTKIWGVHNINESDDVNIGIIKWYGGWRKYVYYTENAYYDWTCLRGIADFCEAMTKEHKS